MKGLHASVGHAPLTFINGRGSAERGGKLLYRGLFLHHVPRCPQVSSTQNASTPEGHSDLPPASSCRLPSCLRQRPSSALRRGPPSAVRFWLGTHFTGNHPHCCWESRPPSPSISHSRAVPPLRRGPSSRRVRRSGGSICAVGGGCPWGQVQRELTWPAAKCFSPADTAHPPPPSPVLTVGRGPLLFPEKGRTQLTPRRRGGHRTLGGDHRLSRRQGPAWGRGLYH